MTIDPSREEWLAARQRAMTESNRGSTTHSIVGAVLGPCPPEPAPKPWQLAGMGSLAVGVAVPSTDASIVFRNQPIAQLNPDEAEAMAAALIEHADYAREQGGYDPWRKEAAALIAAIREPPKEPICGERPVPSSDQVCQRPKGHPSVCDPHRMAEDDE